MSWLRNPGSPKDGVILIHSYLPDQKIAICRDSPIGRDNRLKICKVRVRIPFSALTQSSVKTKLVLRQRPQKGATMSYITKVSVSNGIGAAEIMAESTRTLRSLFEEANILTDRGLLQFNGSILSNAQLDSTLDEVVTDPNRTQVLRMTVKADNAMKATINGAAMVVSSDFTPDELKKIKKYRPDALKLTKDNKTEFMIGIGTDNVGSLNSCGAVFSPLTNAEGKATITLPLASADGDLKAFAEENYGYALLKIRKIEEGLAAAVAEADAEATLISEAITIG